MTQSTTRRLVKSPPELWAELSSEDSLGRHLSEFGEIRITRTDPQTTVAWEGDRISGTVELVPTGWGTKVVMTATPDEPSAASDPEPAIQGPPEPEPRRSFFERLRRRRAPTPSAGVTPEPAKTRPEPPKIQGPTGQRAGAVLSDVLDELGSAHHRPFSRD